MKRLLLKYSFLYFYFYIAMSQLIVNSTVFNYSKTSAKDRLPVMSRILISPVSDRLNGTVINCVDVETAEVSSTTVNIAEEVFNQSKQIIILCYYVIIIIFIVTKVVSQIIPVALSIL